MARSVFVPPMSPARSVGQPPQRGCRVARRGLGRIITVASTIRPNARGLGLTGAHLNITRTADLEALSQAAADSFIELAAAAIAQRGQFTVALTGGSTPRRMYELLTEPPRRGRVDWTRCHFF